MHTLQELLAQYELLETTANHISSIDLYHLSLTCRDLCNQILGSQNTFNCLKAQTLCTGFGLRARQAYAGKFNGLIGIGRSNWGSARPQPCRASEEVEVRVWALRCDAANTNPCCKCGIPLCKECRDVPRYRNHDAYDPSVRPHFNTTGQCWDVIVYCEECDRGVESIAVERQGFCDCNRYERWICLKCSDKEAREFVAYRDFCLKKYGEDDEDLRDTGMVLPDHQHDIALYCHCGARPPKTANVRCIWCRRKHKTGMVDDEDGPGGVEVYIEFPDENPYETPPLEYELP